ncbi:helix-hairpin-helix domain-containing protein [Listeria booriae]|uniref:helix-hairpin-helix domain-containing protein n=1 Tax=Listeria booriae TaxID=1552123 RepID=UPI001C8B4081|nr:helix-hairpin-helix domain-containing protein [Listeria booriae]
MKKIIIVIAFVLMIGSPLSLHSNDVNAAVQSSSVSAESKIDINTATKEQLETLIGIGNVLSQRIIDNRPYKTLDDLGNVKGIGVKTLQKIKDQNIAYVPAPEPDITLDPSLQKAINRTLSQPDSSPLTKTDLEKLTTLSSSVLIASDAKIKSLDGLEFAVNLENLTLTNQAISDVSPIQNLSKLHRLDLQSNLISDLTPLYKDIDGRGDNLKNLSNMNFANNQIENVAMEHLQRLANEPSDCHIILDDNYIGVLAQAIHGHISLMRQKSKNPQVIDLSTFPSGQNDMKMLGVVADVTYPFGPLEYPYFHKVTLMDNRDTYDEATHTVTFNDIRNRKELSYETTNSYTITSPNMPGMFLGSYQNSYIMRILIK